MDRLKRFFLWLFTTIGLVLTIIGAVQFLNLGLKTYVFTQADYNYCRQAPAIDPNGKSVVPSADVEKQCEDQRTANKQSQAADASAFLIVGLPIFGSFLRLARKD